MAVRKSKEETFSVKGNTEEWLTKAEQALHKGEVLQMLKPTNYSIKLQGIIKS